ncbi:MAG: RNA polymerase sigma factor [Fidelibacterota bacterium]
MTDRELVKRFQNGEEGAFDQLVKRHYANTFSLFMRMSGDKMLSDDLCQETYLRVFRGLARFRLEAEFTTWLYRISVNVANSHFRREKLRNIFVRDTNVEHHPTRENPEFEWVHNGLWPAIEKLPKKQRMVIILRSFQQLPFREVGDIMGISENSAKVNYHYAVNNLRKQLGEEQ